ncbi:helix-turn-helix domain-containing protein [Akkermansiaceae bacterium]|nr:helix-turn-helix domain-containing protein [Akkermansiaceae bacterium]
MILIVRGIIIITLVVYFMDQDKHPALVQLGRNIRNYREEKGISQEELAHEAGLDRTYVGGAERGERNLTVLSLMKISKPLKVDLADLVDGVAEADKSGS